MLPAVGVLRTVPCPYYVAGLCDRPHCFFSHAKRDITAVLNNALNKGTGVSTEQLESRPPPSVPDNHDHLKVKVTLESQQSSPLRLPELKEKKSDECNFPEESPLESGLTEVANGLKRKNSGDITGSEHKRQRLGSTELENSKMAAKHHLTSKNVPSPFKLSSGIGEFVQWDKEFPPNMLANSSTIAGSGKEKTSDSHSHGKSETSRRKSSKDKSRSKDSRDKDKRSSSSRRESKSSRHHSGHKTKSSSKSDPRTSRSRSPRTFGSREKTETSTSSSSRHRHHKSRDNIDKLSSTSSSANMSKVTENQNKSIANYSDPELVDSPVGNEFPFPVDTAYFDADDDDDDYDPIRVAHECLAMFNSYVAEAQQSNLSKKLQSDNYPKLPAAEKTLPPHNLGKKRVAHPGAELHSAGPPTSTMPKMTYAQALQLRMHKAQEKNVVQTPQQPSNAISVHPQTTSVKPQAVTVQPSATSANLPQPKIDPPISVGRKRISHVANVAGLLKPNVPATNGNSSKSVESVPIAKVPVSPTVVQTVQKGQNRVAHSGAQLPSGTIKPPLISVNSVTTSKVPTTVRQKMLEQIFAECLKFCTDPAEVPAKALAEELNLISRCSSAPVYVCAGRNTITRLRRDAVRMLNGLPPGPTVVATFSHQNVLAGASGSRVSWSIEPPKKLYQESLHGALLYQRIKKYILTPDELENNGFPRPDPNQEKGKAIAKPRTLGCPAPVSGKIRDKFDRTCDRCKKSYRVNLDGFQILEDQCVYHQGRKYSKRVNGVVEGFYNCCSGDSSASGCTFAPCHVSGSLGDHRGFVSAVISSGTDDIMGSDEWDIVAIDCEMIYTTHGPELARATFIGSESQILYDELVKPTHPIIDYNTRFSGITEDMMKDATTKFSEVQIVMLTHLKPNSILIGHSLESDLLSLKLIHHNIIDTSVLFPHKMGHPYKRALRNLSSEILKKIIQDGEGGHDSAEDARTAMELVLWKLYEDLKIQDIPPAIVGLGQRKENYVRLLNDVVLYSPTGWDIWWRPRRPRVRRTY